MTDQFALLWLVVVGAIAFCCTVVGHHGKKPSVERLSVFLWCLACAPAVLLLLPSVIHTLGGGKK